MQVSSASHPAPLHVVDDEYERLSDIVCAAPVETEALALLWTELLRAQVIPPEHAPHDLVRMNTVVGFTDLLTDQQRTVHLVYPGHADVDPASLAITDTLGAAIIGLRVGATFAWTSGDDGRGLIRIDSVEPIATHRRADVRRRRLEAAEQPGTGSAAHQAHPTVRITPRGRSAMQSARGRQGWVLVFERALPQTLDPLMGRAGSRDPLADHEMSFPTAEAAVAFAERKGWRYSLAGYPGRNALAVQPAAVEEPDCPIDETLMQSFPASDAPSWTLGRRVVAG